MDTRYLFKRHNTWWVKVAVPRTLRQQLGYDLRQSLKTHDLEEAQGMRWAVIESLKRKIEKSKERPLEDLSDKEPRDPVQDYMPVTQTSNPQYYHKVVDCQYACPAHTPVQE